MFEKVLIANRGEIALRVIRACRELNVKTVAIFSEADRNSLHVRYADEAFCVVPGQSARSYLNVPNIIGAAEVAGVDAIHPGYGFLSENANFAEICTSHGIKFIGPPAPAISLMGDKASAKQRMLDPRGRPCEHRVLGGHRPDGCDVEQSRQRLGVHAPLLSKREVQLV